MAHDRKTPSRDDDCRSSHLGNLIGSPTEEAPLLPFTGIRALMLALLDDAVRAYLGPVPRVRQEAEHWVHHSGRRHVFAFEPVCETLGLEPEAVRAALRNMQRDNRRSRGAADLAPLAPNGRQPRGPDESDSPCASEHAQTGRAERSIVEQLSSPRQSAPTWSRLGRCCVFGRAGLVVMEEGHDGCDAAAGIAPNDQQPPAP
jgi:hypothetical protein